MIVYIAGPYEKNDVAVNVRTAIQFADAIVAKGHTPFIPHLAHFWHLVSPKPHSFWLEYDNKFLPLCDCLLRLDGESVGADVEVELAKSLYMPVYYSLEELSGD